MPAAFRPDAVRTARRAVAAAQQAIDDARPRDAQRAVAPSLALGPTALPTPLRAALLVQRGNARSDLDDQSGALTDLRAARRLYEQAGQHVEAGMVDMELGIALKRMGRPAEALQHHEQALATYSEHGDEVDVARCWQNMAGCYAELGDTEREREVLRAARDVFTEHGLETNASGCTHNLALTDWRVGDLADARRSLELLRTSYHRRGMARQHADATDDLGSVLHEFGELDRSEDLHREASAAYEVLGLPAQRCSALVSLAHTLGHAGRLDAADEVLEQAAGLATSPGSIAHVRFERAWSAIRRGDAAAALTQCDALEQVDRARGAESALPYRLWTEGVAHRIAGDHAAAVDRLRRAVTGLRALGNVLPLADATRDLGLALAAAGEEAAAAVALRAAADLFTRMQLPDRAAACRTDGRDAA